VALALGYDTSAHQVGGQRSFTVLATRILENDSHEQNKMLSYRREIAQKGALVLAKSGRLELGDNILRTYRSVFYHCDIFRPTKSWNSVEKNAK